MEDNDCIFLPDYLPEIELVDYEDYDELDDSILYVQEQNLSSCI